MPHLLPDSATGPTVWYSLGSSHPRKSSIIRENTRKGINIYSPLVSEPTTSV
jgi:hypothetical protein